VRADGVGEVHVKGIEGHPAQFRGTQECLEGGGVHRGHTMEALSQNSKRVLSCLGENSQ